MKLLAFSLSTIVSSTELPMVDVAWDLFCGEIESGGDSMVASMDMWNMFSSLSFSIPSSILSPCSAFDMEVTGLA